MSSVVKKVKEAISGGHHGESGDTTSSGERRTSHGKLNMTESEQEKLLAAGYTNQGLDKRGLAGHGTTGTFEALNPNAGATDHPNAMGDPADYDSMRPHKLGLSDAEKAQLMAKGYTDDGVDRRGVAGEGVTGTREVLQQDGLEEGMRGGVQGYDQGQQFESHPGVAPSHGTMPREAGDSHVFAGSTTANAGTAGRGTETYTIQGQPAESNTTRAPVGGLVGAAAGSAAASGGRQEPTIPTSRVIHKCVKCGEDNDITAHFKGNAAYRAIQ